MKTKEIKALLSDFIALNPEAVKYYAPSDSNDEEEEGEQDNSEDDIHPDTLMELVQAWNKDVPVKQVKGFYIKMEEQFGGEDQGSDFWFVLSLTNKTDKSVTYIRFNGWYASYEGHNFDDTNFKIVEPEMVQVRKWKVKK